MAVLSPLWAHLYTNRVHHPNGYEFVRIGECSKYFDNGQLGWRLHYDENGNVIKEKFISYRRDGTAIQT